MRMDELLDKLAQDIETRVDQLRNEWQARTPERNPELEKENEKSNPEEIAGRLNRIMKGLPEEDRYFLDELLLDKDTLYDEERMWFYRSGLADALDILRYLRRQPENDL